MPRPRALVCMCGLVVFAMVSLTVTAAFAEVAIQREGGQLKSITLKSGTGKIYIKRQNWGNTFMTTEKGKRFSATDPFMYQGGVERGDGKKVGGYWNKPEIFDTWKVEQANTPERPGVDIVKITAQQAGMPLCKEVAIARDPGDNVAYVFNRVTALEDLKLLYENELMWFPKVGLYEFYADGNKLTPKDKLSVRFDRWAMVYHVKNQVSVGVACLASESKGGFGRISFRVNPKGNGVEVNWSKPTGPMKKGDARTQQYILVWGDGNLKDKTAGIAKKSEAGELNDKVHVLSGK